MRLVDADALIDNLAKAIPYFIDDAVTEAYVEGLGRARCEIDDSPTIEPERKRAQWIATTSLQEGQITWRDYKCSNCSHHRGKPMNFCEVCGAKMERIRL